MQEYLQLSQRTRNLHASPIREILAITSRPGMISFAGGLPAPETFPLLSTQDIPADRLQYGETEGDAALRRRVADDMRAIGLHCRAEQVLIISGSQQGIDLVAKLFIDEGTCVAVESPTYLAALQVFRFFGARFVDLRSMQKNREMAQGQRPSLAYAIPTFQNPTGHCYTTAERESLASWCDDASVPLFEDDPYRDLSYGVCDRTPVCARLKRSSWVYQGSFSKCLAPGLRLGFLIASENLLPYLTRLKQAADLHSNRISQWLVLEQLKDAQRHERIKGVVELYRQKRDIFGEHLARYFSDLATWETPIGGLFFWLSLNKPQDTGALLKAAIAHGVAFMPGEPFYPLENESGSSALRLNFSLSSPCEAQTGLAILAELVADNVKRESI